MLSNEYFTAPLLFGGFILWEIFGHWKYKRGQRQIAAWDTEERSAQFALEPMLLAERDRLFVKRCKVVFQIVLIQVIQIITITQPYLCIYPLCAFAGQPGMGSRLDERCRRMGSWNLFRSSIV